MQKGTHLTPSCWSDGWNTNVFEWKYSCFLIEDKLIVLDKRYHVTRPEKLLT